MDAENTIVLDNENDNVKETLNGNGKGKGTGKGKSKAKAKEKDNEPGDKKEKFMWSHAQIMIFLNDCKEYQRINGNYQTMSWTEIASQFEKAAGLKDFRPETCRNKFEHMKKLWKPWCDLRRNVTGVGWDHTTGLVTADDEWWERQKQTKDDKYTQFRKKGVNLEMSNLWDDVYGQTVATGKHVMSPIMDVDKLPLSLSGVDEPVDQTGSSTFDSLDTQLEKDAMEDATSLRELMSSGGVNLEGDLQQCLDTVLTVMTSPSAPKGTAGPSKGGSGMSRKTTTKSPSTGPPTTNNKRRRNESHAVQAYVDHTSNLDGVSEKMYSLMEGDVQSKAGVGSQVFSFVEVVKVIERMVLANQMEDEGELWCFAVSHLSDNTKREVFMCLPNDSNRLKWLKYEYNQFYNLYVPVVMKE